MIKRFLIILTCLLFVTGCGEKKIEYTFKEKKIINNLISQIITKLNNVTTSTKMIHLYNELTNEMIELIRTNPDGYCTYNNEMKIIQQIEGKDNSPKQLDDTSIFAI